MVNRRTVIRSLLELMLADDSLLEKNLHTFDAAPLEWGVKLFNNELNPDVVAEKFIMGTGSDVIATALTDLWNRDDRDAVLEIFSNAPGFEGSCGSAPLDAINAFLVNITGITYNTKEVPFEHQELWDDVTQTGDFRVRYNFRDRQPVYKHPIFRSWFDIGEKNRTNRDKPSQNQTPMNLFPVFLEYTSMSLRWLMLGPFGSDSIGLMQEASEMVDEVFKLKATLPEVIPSLSDLTVPVVGI